MLREERNC